MDGQSSTWSECDGDLAWEDSLLTNKFLMMNEIWPATLRAAIKDRSTKEPGLACQLCKRYVYGPVKEEHLSSHKHVKRVNERILKDLKKKGSFSDVTQSQAVAEWFEYEANCVVKANSAWAIWKREQAVELLAGVSDYSNWRKALKSGYGRALRMVIASQATYVGLATQVVLEGLTTEGGEWVSTVFRKLDPSIIKGLVVPSAETEFSGCQLISVAFMYAIGCVGTNYAEIIEEIRVRPEIMGSRPFCSICNSEEVCLWQTSMDLMPKEEWGSQVNMDSLVLECNSISDGEKPCGSGESD